MNKEKYNNLRHKYLNEKIINIYTHLTQKQLKTLEKLKIKVKNELYTVHDFDQKQSELLEYNNNKNKLIDACVSSEECDEIIKIFYKIADEYNL